jgi:hypothetical protein
MFRATVLLLLALTCSGCVVVTTAAAVGSAAVAVGSTAVSIGAGAVGIAADATVGTVKAVGSAVTPSDDDAPRK